MSGVIFDYIHSGDKTNMYESVLATLEISDVALISPTILLKNIGMDSYKQHKIKRTLKHNYGIKLFDQDLESMTIGKINELSVEIQQFQNLLNKNGKSAPCQLLNFKHYVGLAEDKIRTELPDTILYKPQSKCLNMDIDSCAILLPGIDDDATYLSKMAGNLHFPSFVAKYGNVARNVEKLASEILKQIRKLCLHKNFLLVGYSFGSLIAIELARALEELNAKVRVICIDGSPLLFQSALHNLTRNSNEETQDLKLATQIACKIHPTILPGIFRHQLKRFESWDDKMECLTDLTRTLNFSIPEENFISVCKGLFNRTYAAGTYHSDPNRGIQSPIILIKPNEETLSHISYDYGLESCTNGMVDVKIVQGNHYTVLQNSEIVNEINKINF